MKFFKYILFLLLIGIIGFAIYIAVQPNEFEVSRERTINAPASVIYNNVIDLKNWESWSSWVERDPETVITLSDKTKGVDGSYTWVDSHGEGSMKTLATTPNLTIDQELQFGDFHPSKINWKFESTQPNKTKVTWKMNSNKVPFIFKASALFSGGFDSMIGPDFERGLEKLDSIVVSSMSKYNVTVEGVTEHSGGFYLYNTTSCKISDMPIKMGESMQLVHGYAQANNITMAGRPFSIYHKWDQENGNVMFSSCIPTNSKVITSDSNVLTGKLKPFKAVKTVLKGDYKNLKEAWDKTSKHIAAKNLVTKETGIALENYITDPMAVQNPAEWVTEIFVEVN